MEYNQWPLGIMGYVEGTVTPMRSSPETSCCRNNQCASQRTLPRLHAGLYSGRHIGCCAEPGLFPGLERIGSQCPQRVHDPQWPLVVLMIEIHDATGKYRQLFHRTPDDGEHTLPQGAHLGKHLRFTNALLLVLRDATLETL